MMKTQTEQAAPERNGCLGPLLPLILGLGGIRGMRRGGTEADDQAWFEITRQQLYFTRLTQAFHGYRLVHITDLHVDTLFMSAERLASVVQTINRLKADVVVITGDFVQNYQPDYAGTLAGLGELQAQDGVFGVLGNHDHSAGAEWVRECLKAAHVQELNCATHTIQRGAELLHLVGLDDLWPANHGEPADVWTHLPRLEQLTASLPEEGAAILLVHEPDIADVAASTGRFDLQLSGHSHGNQVRIPFYGQLSSLLPPLARQYPRGLYRVEQMSLYTNRGLGTPIRFHNSPEIAVIDLYPLAARPGD
jgi:predicted MPP superfamily phosphohydrolase